MFLLAAGSLICAYVFLRGSGVWTVWSHTFSVTADKANKKGKNIISYTTAALNTEMFLGGFSCQNQFHSSYL